MPPPPEDPLGRVPLNLSRDGAHAAAVGVDVDPTDDEDEVDLVIDSEAESICSPRSSSIDSTSSANRR